MRTVQRSLRAIHGARKGDVLSPLPISISRLRAAAAQQRETERNMGHGSKAISPQLDFLRRGSRASSIVHRFRGDLGSGIET